MATLLEYKCPCCGGALSFDSELQKMKCPYCDTEFETETLRQMDEVLKETSAEDDVNWNTEEKQPWLDPGLCSYVCQSCGGEIITDSTTAATNCPYCDNPVVMSGRVAGTLRPDLVLPFQLDKEAAMEGLKKHLKGKTLLPKIFASENKIQEVKGVYVPVWLFDAEAKANLRFHGTRLRTWSDSNYIYTETRHYSIHRGGDLAFLDVPVDGSTKMPDDLMESIEPFDLTKAVDFQTAYLAGYLADKYDVDAKQSETRANERIRNSTAQAFASTVIGYSTVIPEHTSIQIAAGHVQYALLPVWLLTTKYRDKTYIFAMNGQSGKFVGDLPMDKGAFWKWFAGLTAAVSAAGVAVSWLLGLL